MSDPHEPDQPAPAASQADAPLDIDALRDAIKGLRLGQPLIYFPAIDSTNTHAAELAHAGADEGTLVTTDDQTAGRGRVGRAWKALPNQQLILSLILRPGFPPHFLVMASALAVAGAIEATTGLRADIKWPNDILVAGRKVCGILIETSAGVAIVGMGLNVNGDLSHDPELAARATTLATEAGHPIPREPLAAAILTRLDTLYVSLSAGGEAARHDLRDAWSQRLITIGRRATIRQTYATVEGLALGVNEDGGLLLRTDDGQVVTITWGDVE